MIVIPARNGRGAPEDGSSFVPAHGGGGNRTRASFRSKDAYPPTVVRLRGEEARECEVRATATGRDDLPVLLGGDRPDTGGGLGTEHRRHTAAGTEAGVEVSVGLVTDDDESPRSKIADATGNDLPVRHDRKGLRDRLHR